ncbi:MAG TPA: branched-chain amino acid transaminase [Candidatus Baltobacteraceae bacterium]|nr:branched-chain amino acid transaminase [Candidatus Baltobacteraceae bacterium]
MIATAPARERMWFDGELVDADEIAVRPFTHALHYGSGVFEGIRAYETRKGTGVFRLSDHLRRFFVSADVYGLHVPYDQETLARAVFATLEANAFSSGYIRPLAYFGEKGISLAPTFHCPTHVLIALKPLAGSLLGESAGIRVTMSPWQKTPSRSLPSTVKACGHYTNSILALQDAQRRGFEEAILLNDRGDVAEGTGENIFVVRNGALRTNDASADILAGITQASVVELARDRGMTVEIGNITPADLLAADEIFFTGTAAEVMPILQIDDYVLPQARPVTDELCRAYARAVRGADPRHPGWVEYA